MTAIETAARRAVALVALLVLAAVFVVATASAAGAHPQERCFFGWKEVSGVVVEGSPEDPKLICYDKDHRHYWRDAMLYAATHAGVFTLLFALIVTPEALERERARRRWRRRPEERPASADSDMLPRYGLAIGCSLFSAILMGGVAPSFLEWVFSPVGTTTVALYAVGCGVVTAVSWRIIVRKRCQGELAASPAAAEVRP